jgi:hypothetical protein
MTQPFWDSGVTTGNAVVGVTFDGAGQPTTKFVALSGNTDCLLPDVSILNILTDRWNWDVIYIACQRLPGLCEVEFGREHRVDKRSAIGNDGTQITSLGYKAADITIKTRIWTPQQLRDFETITIPTIQPRPGKAHARPTAVVVDYPSLAMWGIFSLFVTKVAGPKKTGTPGVWEITITASEVSPLVPVGTTTAKGGSIAQQQAYQPPAASPPSQTSGVLLPATGQ